MLHIEVLRPCRAIVPLHGRWLHTGISHFYLLRALALSERRFRLFLLSDKLLRCRASPMLHLDGGFEDGSTRYQSLLYGERSCLLISRHFDAMLHASPPK